MFSKLLTIMTVAVVAANAQGTSSVTSAPSSIPSLTPCILACIGPAASQNGCSSFTNVQCVCTSAQFQADAGACLQQHCSAAELQSALALQSAECAALGLSASGTSATPHSVSFTLSSSGSGTTTAVSSTATTTTASSGSSSAPSTTAGSTTGSSSSTASSAASSAAASPTTSSAAAPSMFVNGGVGALVAIIAGLLAI